MWLTYDASHGVDKNLQLLVSNIKHVVWFSLVVNIIGLSLLLVHPSI